MGRRSMERGSVSVEFTATLPLVAVSLLLVAQMGLLVAQQLTVQHAAREGVRAAAIWNDDQRARDAALASGSFESSRVTVTISPLARDVGSAVRVAVTYRPSLMPFVGAFIPSGFVLSGFSEMRTERAQGG